MISNRKLCQMCALLGGENYRAPPPHKCTASLAATYPLGNERLGTQDIIAG